MAMGKAIAGGVPMGAVGIGDSITGLKPGMHGSTFGGNPLACAAALAHLAVLEEEDVIRNSAELCVNKGPAKTKLKLMIKKRVGLLNTAALLLRVLLAVSFIIFR